MSEKVNYKSEFRCNICSKHYASRSSLCNHNKKFHNNNIIKCNTNVIKCNTERNTNVIKCNTKENKLYYCSNCNKSFLMRQYRWKHEQKCKNLLNSQDKIDKLEETINDLQQQIAEIIKIKGRVHHKTLEKFNNYVENINNGNIVNGNIINNTYVKFGNVCYEKIFNNQEILSILNKQYLSLEEGINKTHFNEKIPSYSNIFITNLKDDISYIFNGIKFITVKKHEMLNELINTHINEIYFSYEKNKDKLNDKYADRIEKFLNKLNDNDTKYTDPENNRVYDNYKAYKMDAIKLAIYNKSDKKKLESLKNIKLIEKIDDEYDSDCDVDIKI